jgi:hypothetical protein
MPVEDDGHSSDNHVPDSSAIERRKNRFIEGHGAESLVELRERSASIHRDHGDVLAGEEPMGESLDLCRRDGFQTRDALFVSARG